MKRFYTFLKAIFHIICVAGIASCSDDENVTSVSTNAEDNYCLMFYVAGGDYEHDITLFSSAEEAAARTKDNPHLSVTVLFEGSGKDDSPEHSGVRRYTAQDGNLVEDTDFDPGAGFSITDPAQLSDFIRWSAGKYPDRKYIFVVGGHGSPWQLDKDLPSMAAVKRPNIQTRATLYDGTNGMSSADMAKGLKDSGVPIPAFITNSCMQGSLETLAEWEGCANYLLCSPYSIPDIAFDYASFMDDLEKGIPLENALISMAHSTMDVWQAYSDFGKFDTVLFLTRLDNLTPLWHVLKETFSYMQQSVDGMIFSTDSPAVVGEPYYKGYERAFIDLSKIDGGFSAPDRDLFVDLFAYLGTAIIESGNIELTPYVNRVNAVLDSLTLVHLQSNGKVDHKYNVLWQDTCFLGTNIEAYRTCRFDQQTGWSNLRQLLLNKKGNNP